MMKKLLRWLLPGLLVALVAVQFIRPAKNDAPVTGDDFIARYQPPAEVETMLRVGCYDCHSNQTRYPWYAEVQPVAWWLSDHIADAKGELNFSEFGSYRIRRKFRKLEEMITQVEKGEMPIASYRLMHADAEFTRAQKDAFLQWVGAMRDSIKATTPPDSLARPKPGS
jgi:hypothetical protein